MGSDGGGGGGGGWWGGSYEALFYKLETFTKNCLLFNFPPQLFDFYEIAFSAHQIEKNNLDHVYTLQMKLFRNKFCCR